MIVISNTLYSHINWSRRSCSGTWYTRPGRGIKDGAASVQRIARHGVNLEHCSLTSQECVCSSSNTTSRWSITNSRSCASLCFHLVVLAYRPGNLLFWAAQFCMQVCNHRHTPGLMNVPQHNWTDQVWTVESKRVARLRKLTSSRADPRATDPRSSLSRTQLHRHQGRGGMIIYLSFWRIISWCHINIQWDWKHCGPSCS